MPIDMPPADMQAAIIQAMKDQKVISCTYNGLPRLIEAHAIGKLVRNKRIGVRVYQVGGESQSHDDPYWRLFYVDRMQDVVITNERARAPRHGYKKGDKAMRKIYYQIGD